jgi:hypothetical protein
LCSLVEQLSLSQAKTSGNSDVDDNELDSVIGEASHEKDKKKQKKKPLVRADASRKKKEAQKRGFRRRCMTGRVTFDLKCTKTGKRKHRRKEIIYLLGSLLTGLS